MEQTAHLGWSLLRKCQRMWVFVLVLGLFPIFRPVLFLVFSTCVEPPLSLLEMALWPSAFMSACPSPWGQPFHCVWTRPLGRGGFGETLQWLSGCSQYQHSSGLE